HLNRHRLHEIEAQIFWLLGFKENRPKKQELILVVDDQPTNLKLFEAFLDYHGYQVAVANGGENALQQAQSLAPDLILLDIWMPGMDGFAVCKQLKAHPSTHDIPILFVTSNAIAKDKLKGFEVGGADYVTRPFELEEVLARLEYQLRLRTLQKRLAAQNEALQREIQGRRIRESKYQRFFEQALDGMYQLSADGQSLEINSALAHLYGYASVEELRLETQEGIAKLYVDSDRLQQLMFAIGKMGRVTNFESQVYRADGSIIWIAENTRIVQDTANNLLYYEGTVRDITSYKVITSYKK
ncbi:MAG: response regulator, partial [Leptolyngbyaceae bacterium]|nr:response regulator [Leptolyngbyaceae bacterium]